MRQRGFTVFELMCAVSLFAVICSTMISIEGRIARHEKVARRYVSDLAECRRALRHLEQDLRAAGRVDPIASGVRIHADATTTEYTLENGVLRRARDGQVRTVGRRIAAFEAVQNGRRVDVRVMLQHRSKRRNTNEAAIYTSVFLRGGVR